MVKSSLLGPILTVISIIVLLAGYDLMTSSLNTWSLLTYDGGKLAEGGRVDRVVVKGSHASPQGAWYDDGLAKGPSGISFPTQASNSNDVNRPRRLLPFAGQRDGLPDRQPAKRDQRHKQRRQRRRRHGALHPGRHRGLQHAAAVARERHGRPGPARRLRVDQGGRGLERGRVQAAHPPDLRGRGPGPAPRRPDVHRRVRRGVHGADRRLPHHGRGDHHHRLRYAGHSGRHTDPVPRQRFGFPK